MSKRLITIQVCWVCLGPLEPGGTPAFMSGLYWACLASMKPGYYYSKGCNVSMEWWQLRAIHQLGGSYVPPGCLLLPRILQRRTAIILRSLCVQMFLQAFGKLIVPHSYTS